MLKFNHYVHSPSKLKKLAYLLCFSSFHKHPCPMFIFASHCLSIKLRFFSSRFVLHTISFLRTWMPGVSLFSTYAFKQRHKVLSLQQFGEIASCDSFFLCCTSETRCLSYNLSLYVIYVCFLAGRLSLIFLSFFSGFFLVLPFCSFTSQPFQGTSIRHSFESCTAPRNLQQHLWRSPLESLQ